MRAQSLSAATARRVALAAQGFTDPRPAGVPDRRAMRRVVARTGLFQIDSVNVLVRAHYLPLFSRLGPYPTAMLDRAAYRRPRDLFEYWGHEASLLPVGVQPLLRWRMALARDEAWGGMRRIAQDNPRLVRAVLDEIAQAGPLSAGDLEKIHGTSQKGRRSGPWWDWSHAKLACEYLFWAGEITTASRRGFERLYDLPERVLPRDVLDAPTPEPAQAHRDLLRLAARSFGVATERDLRDYYRLPVADTRARLPELVEAGELIPVSVEGWRQPAFMDPNARVPRRVDARALIAPFDPLIWERERTERLFGFRYRIEIYVPAPRRVHGYYVLPFLLGDRLVARVDLKADRQQDVLLVQSAYREAEAPTAAPDGRTAGDRTARTRATEGRTDEARTVEALTAELESMAGWLGLSGVRWTGRGDLRLALLRAG